MSSTNITTMPGVALVTGAGGEGIGAATARAFAASGCRKLVLTDINAANLQTAAAHVEGIIAQAGLQPEILTVAGNIADPTFVDALFEQVASKYGRLDYAVNCAGVAGNGKPSDETSVADFDRISGVNFRGVWLCARKELEMMKGQDPVGSSGRAQRGSIVNIASQLGAVGRPDAPVYCATKSAVIGLTRCDAIDYAKYGIRVNAVCPGVVETPMTKPKEGPTFSNLEAAVNIAPMRRMGTPEEIADVVVFLASEKASFVQGAAWMVDGGYTIN